MLASRYLVDFADGAIDRLDVVYTKFESASRQQAVVETLLPLGELGRRTAQSRVPSPHEERAEYDSGSRRTQYEFLPSAESILDELVPTSFKVRLFKCFLDAAVSEQIAGWWR